MPAAASNTQAVFLIDVSLCRNGGTKWDEAISLCVFRLLSFLHSQLQIVEKTKTKALRWGYKLFDIDEKGVKVELKSSGFQDFKLKTFHEFEIILKRCLQHVKESFVTESETNINNDRQSEQTKKGFLMPSHPSLCLSKRLTETLYDFPWEMPDVGSPVKGKKMLSQFESSAEHSNFVFLISRVPCDKKALRHYCNKVVMDKNVFIDAFMPQELRRQFYEEHKIQLHWIDTGRYKVLSETPSTVPPEKKSYDIVRHSLRMVGGLLIPFHSLVTHLTSTAHQHQQQQRQQGENVGTSAGTEEEGEETKRRDHVTIMLSSFACMSICSAMVPCWAGKKHGGSGGAGWRGAGSGTSTSSTTTTTTTSTATLVFEQLGAEGDGSRKVNMKLVPITRKTAKRSQTSGDKQQLELRTGNDEDSDSVCILVTQQSTIAPLPHPSHHTPFTSTSTPTTSPLLRMRACMEKSQVRQLAGNCGQHSLCLVGESAPQDQHRAFSSLLQLLNGRQQALILSVTVNKVACPHLAVLEASSGCSAHLTYLSLGLTLQVEKQLTLQPGWGAQGQGREEPEEGSSCQSLSLDEFQDRAANAISVQTAFRQLGKEQDVVSAASKGGGLWTGVLNPWHSPGSVPNIQSALDKLTDTWQDVGQQRSQMEQCVRRDLREMYRRANQPPFPRHPSKHSTPVFPPSSSAVFPLPFTSSSASLSAAERSGGSFSQDGFSGTERRKSAKHESILTRGRLMVIKAKNLSNSNSGGDEVDGEYTPQLRPLAPPPVVPRADISQAEVKSEDDLRRFVGQEYSRALQTEVDLEPVVHTLVSATLRFWTAQDHPCPQRGMARFLEEHALKKQQDLRAELSKPAEPAEDKSHTQKEFKLQAFLRLEIESMCSDVEQVDPAEREESRDQIVELLRSLLFSQGPKPVLQFLNTVVLDNYCSTLPHFLVTVYDELMQPLPPELEGEGEGPPHRAPGGLQSLSVGSTSGLAGMDEALQSMAGSEQSNTSPRRRTRSSVHAHPSLSGIGSKRQIEVKAPAAKRPKGSSGKKGVKVKAKKDKSKSPAKQKEKAGGKKMARRNLFNTDLCKVPSKRDNDQEARVSRKRQPSTSSGHRGHQKTTFVAETPCHKQRGWRRHHREETDPQAPGPSRIPATDVQVVLESPCKDMEPHKSTPGRYKAPRRVLRQSFYSSGSEHSSRTLSRALENPANISGRHHVAHLEDSKPGQLAEALGREGQGRSPRSRITALLNPRSSHGTSPELEFYSPARNTRSRSRTPQKPSSSSSSRRHLHEDTRSMPAYLSVAKILDFASPEKKKPSATASPEKKKLSSTVTSAMLKPFAAALASVTSHSLSSPPRVGRGRRNFAVDDFPPSKPRDNAGQVTPTSSRAGGSQPRTPPKLLSTSGQGLRSSPLSKQKQGVGSRGGRKGAREGVTTPRKRGRGDRGVKGVSPHGSSSSSSTGSQQSSILDYVSPSRRHAPSRHAQTTGQEGTEGSLSFLPLPSGDGAEVVDWQPRPRPSYNATTPTKARQARLSPVTTPTKSVLRFPPAHLQQFLSPVKTPTKSILKSSPMPGYSGTTTHGMGLSITPQKVTSTTPLKVMPTTPQKATSTTHQKVRFRERGAASPWQGDEEDEVRSPDYMSRWQRRKRRWSGDHDKSPASSPHREGIHRQPGASSKAASSKPWHSSRQQDCRLDHSSLGFAPGSGPSRVTATAMMVSRKRSSVLSDADSITAASWFSSPRKRQRLDSSEKVVVAGISRPALFSENAMDSYFSASSEDMFLGTSSSQLLPPRSPVLQQQSLAERSPAPQSPAPHSPLFKGKGKAVRNQVDSLRLFDFAAGDGQSSFDSVGGSQGFEVLGARAGRGGDDRGGEGEEEAPPPSPTFNTSPALKRGRHEGSRTPPFTRSSGERSPGTHHAGSVTPLRVKGEVTELKYASTVCSSSLAQLIRSPLMLGKQAAAQDSEQAAEDSRKSAPQDSKQSTAQDSKQPAQNMRQQDAGHSSTKKRPQKKLKM